jgi:hypothetical protein
MISFDLTINIFVLLAIIVGSLAAGMLGRGHQLARKNRQMAGLEMEMVQAHAELLETQREFCELEVKMKELQNRDPSIPVITMKQVSKETEAKREPLLGEPGSQDRSNRTA